MILTLIWGYSSRGGLIAFDMTLVVHPHNFATDTKQSPLKLAVGKGPKLERRLISIAAQSIISYCYVADIH